MSSNMKNGLILCAGVCMTMFLLIMLGAEGTTFTAILCLVGGAIFLGFVKYVSARKDAEATEFLSFDEKTYTLTVNKRYPQIARAVKIVDANNISIKYKPEETHFTAVSSGGVTVGGTYTTGGYNYIAGVDKNGQASLKYMGRPINKIQLTDELYHQAQNSSIAAFLNDKKQIEVRTAANLSAEDLAAARSSLMSTGFVGNAIANAGLPTKGKCITIMNWLTNP